MKSLESEVELLRFTIQLSPEEEARRLRAYEETSCDREAAAILDMPKSSFNSWRTSRGLPPKTQGIMGRPVDAMRDAVYRFTFRSTHSDGEAAKVLNIPVAKFASWRRRRGMHSRYEGRVPR